MRDTVTTYVGVRELKAKLSEYLARAAAGETIVVTDRGKAKAEIRALSAEERIEFPEPSIIGVLDGRLHLVSDGHPLGVAGKELLDDAVGNALGDA